MKSNPSTFSAVPIYLYEDKVYTGYVNNLGQVFYNNRIIATRKTIKLVQDAKYKTQFYNEELVKAIPPKTLETEIKLFDESGKAIAGRYNIFELDREHSSITFSTEPSTLPKTASVVIYCAEDSDKVLLTNGENTMDNNYTPTKDKHVITKDYLDSKMDALKAGMNTLEKFSIMQGNNDLIRGNCYVDNQLQDIILISASSKDVTINVDPFICNRQYDKEEVSISVKVGPIEIYSERLIDIIAGASKHWKLTSTKNIFDEGVNSVYWLNGYQVTFPTYMYLYSLMGIVNDNPVVDVTIKVTDGSKVMTASKQVGLDEEIRTYKYDGSYEMITWDEVDLLNFKTVYVSGRPYLPAGDDSYALPINVRYLNKNLRYFRPGTVLKVGSVERDPETNELVSVCQKELGLDSHEPYTIENTYGTHMNIKINERVCKLYIELYNLKGDCIYRYEKDCDCESSKDIELYRVNTPHANRNATVEDMTDWDPKALTNSWDMILYKGEYTSGDDYSALAFKIPTEAGKHYSHIKIDAEYDGKMQIMSSGNTAWLNCASMVKPFKTPTELNEGCKLGEGNTYTFGQVVYSTPVFVRFTNCTRVKINSFEIN